MSTQYDHKNFMVRERYKFWRTIKCKLGETTTELAARVRQMATTSITNPLDEALRTCFICAVNNEAVLKSVFRKTDDLDFSKTIEIATEVEEANKTAKAQIHARPSDVNLLNKRTGSATSNNNNKSSHQNKPNKSTLWPEGTRGSCGSHDHPRKDCKHRHLRCHFCHKDGHISRVCGAKQSSKGNNITSTVYVLNSNDQDSPSINIKIKGKHFHSMLDTGATCNIMSTKTWSKLNKPVLQPATAAISATGHQLSTCGSVNLPVSITSTDGTDVSSDLLFMLTKEDLNLLGVSALNCFATQSNPVSVIVNKITNVNTKFYSECIKVSKEFPNLWKPELEVSKTTS